MIETWYNQDLSNPVKVQYLAGNVFSQDNNGNKIGVNVYKNGQPVNITGTISANVIRADGATVAVSGTSSANQAYIILPQACYAVPGVVSIIIKETSDSDITTLCAVVANVYQSSTDSVVDPGSIIPDISSLINAINSAVESIPPDYSDFVDAFLSRGITFDLCAMYGIKDSKTAGDVVYTWDGDECTVSGTANGTSFNNILNIAVPSNGARNPFGCYVEMSGTYQNVYVVVFEMVNGSATQSKVLTESGSVYFSDGNATGIIVRLQVTSGTTASGKIKVRVMNQDATPFCTHPFYKPSANTDLQTLKTGAYLIDDSTTYTNAPPYRPAFLMVFEDLNASLQIAYPYTPQNRGTFVKVKQVVGGTWTNWIPLNVTGANISEFASGGTVNVDNVRTNGFYLIYDSLQYENLPFQGGAGMLFVFGTMNLQLQIAIPFTPNAIHMRVSLNGGSWGGWNTASGTGGNTYNVTNEYTFPEYSQTLQINASPEITADTNNYLASSGDDTDRTTDILSMLGTHGVCRLGPGKFVIGNLQMPDNSAIIGGGYSTLLHMSGSADGFAVKMGSRCMIENVRIRGAESAPIFGSTIGGRHGILWQGDYTEHTTAPEKSMVDNVWIENFSGGGITCYDTGYGTLNALEVVNAYVTKCWAGINISYWSEFHKFTNVRSGQCYIGCVNNGGNNIFVNCDFSLNEEIAMLMDNSQGQSPNNTHGSAIGCVFNHTSHAGTSNAGVGIKMLNCSGNGFIFNGCQIFFSQIYLEDTDGIVFSNCDFGYMNCDIDVSGGGAVLFMGNMHQAKPGITITNNPNVKFVNCYVKTTGAVVQP